LTCDLQLAFQFLRSIFLQQHEDLALSVFSVGWQQAFLAFSLVSFFSN
jgi:hypothetical protein